MRIDYEIIWEEDGKMKFKQFSYDVEETELPLNSHLPADLYEFYVELQDNQLPIIVVGGEPEKTGTGVLRYCGADPVYDEE